MINLSMEARGGSDYNDFYVISKSEVEEQIDNAETFLSRIKEYLNNKKA